jgi:diaminohydroxyphosphoribosylaminopyrimidine deaminase/5-amino-6-(5-phosphoribosylamino)uracil reductase
MGERSPVRVVLDSHLKLPGDAKLISSIKQAPLWVFCAEDASKEAESRLVDAGVQVQRITPNQVGGLDLEVLLSALAERGITRLLIEGGPGVAGSFWRAKLVDEVYIYQGPEPTGTSGLKALSAVGIDAIGTSPTFTLDETCSLGRDTLSIYRRNDV